MAHKRKRSISELTTSPSSTSSFNSPPSVAGMPSPFVKYDTSPIYLHSRTLKRFRNSRPSEEEVHQRTLNILFSAQQQPHHHSSAAYEQDHQEQQQQVPQSNTRNQQSLHRFWNIRSAPTASAAPTARIDRPSSCEDCGTSFGDGNGDEMDVDGLTPEDHACGACGRHVCFSCSVSRLGEERRCLRCVNRTAGVENVGWPNAGVTVC